jgi:hypothetical protein
VKKRIWRKVYKDAREKIQKEVTTEKVKLKKIPFLRRK